MTTVADLKAADAARTNLRIERYGELVRALHEGVGCAAVPDESNIKGYSKTSEGVTVYMKDGFTFKVTITCTAQPELPR